MNWSQHWKLVAAVQRARLVRRFAAAGDIRLALNYLALGNRVLGMYRVEEMAMQRPYDRARAAIDIVERDIERMLIGKR